jgi:hypothetical protein
MYTETDFTDQDMGSNAVELKRDKFQGNHERNPRKRRGNKKQKKGRKQQTFQVLRATIAKLKTMRREEIQRRVFRFRRATELDILAREM